jgi:hypothetical protein
MNTAFRDLLVARAQAAIAAAQGVSNLVHAGHKGLLREIVVRELLRPLLPTRAGLGHGLLIAASGEQSTEQDVVVFDRDVVPSFLLDTANGLFPIDAALYVVEVKSRLTAPILREVHRKSDELKSMTYVPGPRPPEAVKPPEGVIPCLFAFDSDLSPSGKSELDRYLGILKGSEPGIRSLCVVGRGYWWFQVDKWHCRAATSDHAEVIEFLAGILNRYSLVLETRSRPSMSAYLG